MLTETSTPASPSESRFRRPEILAPAGNEEMMRAAVENGADAVYFGLQDFNARLRADNFAAADLPRLMGWLHERGVRGYVTLNTLVFCSELDNATHVLRTCSQSGVDAVLVQDLGIAALANQLFPDLPIHASTQMTLTSGESVEATEALGLKLERIVAARELSIKELQKLRRATSRDIEVFVHGAICVAYSGQCLTSEALGGRSANRGECAQACRLPYDLIVDGEVRDMADVKYLLSPKDLAAYEDIGRLVEAGIVSLKIEGRLKSPLYVAATVRSYREAIDQVFADGGDHLGSPVMDEATRQRLEMTFSRGFTGGYLHDIDHQAVVEGRFPKKRGIFLGRVTAVGKQEVRVSLEGPLKLGDGIVFDGGHPDRDEEGGRVYEMKSPKGGLKDFKPHKAGKSEEITLTFGRGRVNFHKISVGDRVWKTSDPELDRELAASYSEGKVHFRRPVWARVSGQAGQPLRLALSDENGITVEVTDTNPAEAAAERPLTSEVLRTQLDRFGNTPFSLAGLNNQIEGEIMVPFSRLNSLRRRAAEALELRRRVPRERREVVVSLEEMRQQLGKGEGGTTVKDQQLSVLCRTLEQVSAAAANSNVYTIYTDFEDARLHREARKLVPCGGPRFVPATLRVMKPGEAPIARKLMEANPDAVLVRNLAAWQVLRVEQPQLELLGDYSLNVANDLTARLLRAHGFSQLVPSYDLNIGQLLDLLRHADPDWFEVTIHQYMPMFHMEHCVFCRFLSTGTDFTNCGRPCDTHTLALRDRMGYSHPVKADAGCRNTVFNAVAQSGSEYLDALREAGVRKYRLDFLTENAEQVEKAISAYLPAIRGDQDGHQLWKQLRAVSKLGVTRGSLDHA
ncbi:MAG: U32 family peptidase [Candidatus Sumerlaeaceae bacterium]|nr:U32 family peptidase [Candidatus Sumerlaeaceae bacterium]